MENNTFDPLFSAQLHSFLGGALDYCSGQGARLVKKRSLKPSIRGMDYPDSENLTT
jgi:hypothetical protein